ncbi:NAD(P)-dependent dehydrogenase, short-chain alcohol dehydrogenase family [Massilia sp. CF038]|nr:NAD(P)-dependent dehydrogenase, short-chain alcohol dehydrogenase family [Massilia sp. CF038]
MGRLTGKTALITGGTTGIGLATARLFLQEGARVAIVGVDPERVASAAHMLGAGAIALCADVASKTAMEGVAARLKAEFGTLDVVFANAGIAQPMPFSDVDDGHIERQFDVNFKGVVYTIQAALPLLNNPASVVLTSTTMIDQGVAGMSVYAATKAAVRSLARTLSAELAPRGVRVNAISPGLIDTPIYGKLGLPAQAVQEWAGQLMAKVPAGRFGQAEEVARAVLFMASDDSLYMMGENLLFDGGMATV